MSRRVPVTLAALLFAAILAIPSTLLADTYTFTYTGNDFTTFSSNGLGTPYTTADSVSGSFTVDLSSLDNLNGAIYPTSYSFSDGVQTLTSFGIFALYTNGSGNITGWNIDLVALPFSGITTLSSGDSATNGAALVEVPTTIVYYLPCGYLGEDECPQYITYDVPTMESSNASNTTAGIWTVTDDTPVAATPEPSSLALLGTGLLGAVSFGRSRFMGAR